MPAVRFPFDTIAAAVTGAASGIGRALALQLAARHGRLTSVEVNDNWREWDDDLAVGSVHLIETLEFFLAVRKIGWGEVILLDQFPFREDPVAAARESIRTVRQLTALLDRLDLVPSVGTAR